MATSNNDDEDNSEYTRVSCTRRMSVSAEVYNPEDDCLSDTEIVSPKSDEQRQRLLAAVASVFMLNSLHQEQLDKVIDAMHEVKVKRGDTIFRQGDDADEFYIIDSGDFDVKIDNSIISTLCKGSFGELALMYNTPRTATITAKTDGIVWAMNRTVFQRIVLRSAFKKRMTYESFLSSVPILSSLTEYQRATLADALKTKMFEDGEKIFSQGDQPDGMYFVVSGAVRLTFNQVDGEREISMNGVGSYFGELALMTNEPRCGNIYAVGDVEVAFLERSGFERLLGPCIGRMREHSRDYIYESVQL